MEKMTIEEQSALVSREFQRLGPLAWIRSDDKRLFMPALEEEVKPGGLIGPVYKEEQTPTGLWRLRPVVKLVPLLPKFQGGDTEPPIWLICQQQHVDDEIWKQSFGSLEDYRPLQWTPIWTDQHQVFPLHLTSEPEEADSWAMIYFLRSTKEPVTGEFAYEYRRAAERLRQKTWEADKYRVRHTVAAFGQVPNDPGKNNAGASFPTVSKGA